MFEYLVIGITFAFAAAVQPGPFQTFLITRTLSRGWKRTLPAAFAPAISDGPIILLVIFVLNNIPQQMVIILQMLGGLLLLYLSYGAYQSFRNFNFEESLSNTTSTDTLPKAIMVNFINPNPYISWSLIMGPLLLEAWAKSPISGIALVLGFYIPFVFLLMVFIILVGQARNLGKKATKIGLGISVVALLLFGLYQIAGGIQNLLGIL